MASTNVIVFGPTGNCGAAAAQAARGNGAKVFLAMRNTEKSIPGLSAEQEQQGGFERIQADLTKPETVTAAVKKADAKHAFIYLMFGSPDNMRSSIEALKAGGIEQVVFLSSLSVHGDPRTVQQHEIVGYAHAQVEINLQDVFGAQNVIAVRPGWFNTNAEWWKTHIAKGEVKIVSPDAKFDWISPGDIGKVCGIVLARGAHAVAQSEGNSYILLCGPEMVSQKEAAEKVADLVGVKATVKGVDAEEGVKMQIEEHGTPEPVAKYLVDVLVKAGKGEDTLYQSYDEGAGNLKRYLGNPIKIDQWLKENKALFTA